jgi:FtsP/CotA-like multicopper oxidase with cupredoxin domain
MSDIDFNPANGYVGKFYGGTNSHFGTNVWLNINSLVEMCHLNRIGDTNGSVTGCTLAGSPGATVLVNGAAPNPGGINSSFTVHSGQKVRLRLLNEAMSRDFRMTLLYPNNRPTGNTNIYRIGGQGGLLDNMRLEGGTNNGGTLTTNGWWDTQYGRGEIVIGSGERSDVIIYPTATNNGDVIRLVGNPLPAPFNLSGPDQNNVTPITNNYPIAYFTIIGVNDGNTNTPPTNGAPILPTGQTNESYRAAATNPLMIPPAPYAGTSNPVITLGNGTPVNTTNTPANNPVVYARGNPNVDGYSAMLDSNLGGGSWTNIVRAPSTLYARVGDMLELSVANSAGGPIHPFHLHGFSLQPLRLVNGATTYTYPYNEFVDTIEVYPGETLVFRVRLDDRPKFCDSGAGGPVLLPCTAGSGAVGRWLFHCHIFLHAGAGMMGEVDVLPLQQTNYVQLPDLTTNGVDVLATTNTGSRTVADDFRCLTNGLITGISIWGSWLNDLVDSNSRFELKLWTDVPAAGGNPSRPGWQAWRQFFPAGTYTATLVSSNTVQPFYDPSTSLLGTNSRVYRYDFVIPPELAFNQQSNTIYWLSVSAYSANRFGWHSCLISANFNDAAEWSTSLFGPNWSALLGTNGLNQAQPINASFLLTSPGNSSALLLSGSSITVPPAVLSVDMVDGKLNISWTGAGTLQSAEDIAGPWTDVNGATSPYLIPFDKPQSFYRVKMP